MSISLRVVVRVALCFTAIISIAANVWFIVGHTMPSRRQVLGGPSLLKEGDIVRPFVARDLHGDSVQVDYDKPGVPTVLYVLTPGCHWCAQNSANIRAIADQSANKFRVVAISLDDSGLAEYVRNEGYAFPVLGGITPELRAAYALGPTPETLLIDRDGRVVKVWLGTFQDPVLKGDVESTLQVTLPESSG